MNPERTLPQKKYKEFRKIAVEEKERNAAPQKGRHWKFQTYFSIGNFLFVPWIGSTVMAFTTEHIFIIPQQSSLAKQNKTKIGIPVQMLQPPQTSRKKEKKKKKKNWRKKK